MTMTMRHAIYWAPSSGSPLAALGAAWLGRDAATGESVPRPALTGFEAGTLDAITAEPRRYGLHATLKPPFRLAAGRTEAALVTEIETLAAALRPIAAPALQLRRIGGFLALVPGGASADLRSLAAACVERLDPFRAPPTPAELARRRAAGLSPAQEANLARWGYPYVMEEFRFHVTLTGTVESDVAERLLPPLAKLFAPATREPLELREIALFVEPAPGAPFVLKRRFALG